MFLGSEAVQLGNEDRHGLSHLWINVWVAGDHSLIHAITECLIRDRVTTFLENLEMLWNFAVVRKMSGNWFFVRELSGNIMEKSLQGKLLFLTPLLQL